jgi:predicted nucleic acid-binding Zn ribbon protein
MARCEACGRELQADAQRFCSDECHGVFIKRSRQGTRRSPGRTTARRRRRRGR